MATGPYGRVHVDLASGVTGAVARITIDNATKLNVIGSALMAELVDAVTALGAREDLRAVVLTGAGDRAFIGGANILEMAGLDATRAREFITGLHRMCAALRDLPVPVIARINGYALGAGLEVAAACDLRIAASNAAFGMPEVRVGIPSVIEAALLTGLIGWGRTRELLLLGESIDAETALRWGLVQKVAPVDGLDAAVEACVGALLKAGPRALRLQKTLIRRWEDLPLSAAIAAGIDSFADAYATDEPSRLMRTFLERPRR
ncbi:MAG TPA: enoyl-CoA hydratase [Burkholderiales bacterium]|nr:enoyl-CoA hydratase [Burkholderiales bacterium]